MSIALSELDSQRFGIHVARAQVTAEGLDEALEWCHVHRIDLLMARLPARTTPPAAELERRGFEKMDSLVNWVGDLTSLEPRVEAAAIRIRTAHPDEAARVARLARRAFRGHVGHYHRDPRLAPAACDEVYADWAHRSCRDSQGCAVLLAERGDALVGFSVVRLTSPGEAEGVLSGVDPGFRRQGAYAALHAARSRWCLVQGAKRLVATTVSANAAISRCYARDGFTPSHGSHTFHAWLRPR